MSRFSHVRRILATFALSAIGLALPAGAHALPSAPGVDAMLADDWCGTERTVADKDSGPRLPYYKVVYAYASDVGNRFAQFAPVIQRYTKAAAAKVAMASDKTVRFDRKTSCGTRYLDIRTLALPDTSYYYGGGIVTRIPETLTTLLPREGSRRNYLVFVDTGNTGDYYALGQPYADASPGPGNLSNTHAKPALAYIVGGGARDFFPTDPPRTGAQFADVILQEILHNLGAVQMSAPHSSGEWHCWQGWDVMCYQSRSAAPALQFDCPFQESFRDLGSPLDCGADDYFNPAPPPGSYLAGHWNTYDSVYLCPVDDCGPVPLRAGAAVPAVADDATLPPALVETHVISRPATAPTIVIPRVRWTVTVRQVLRDGLRVRFTVGGPGAAVRAVLRQGERTLAVRDLVTHAGKSSVLFRLSRAQRRRLAGRRRVVFRVVLSAIGGGSKPASATIVARRAR